MGTWCLLRGLMQRIKYGNVFDDMSRAVIQVHSLQHKIFLSKMKAQSFHARTLYTSQVSLSQKSKRDQVKKNPLKTNKNIKLERVYLENNMTIAQLAAALKKSTDHVYEVLMFIPETEAYDSDKAVLPRDISIAVVKKSGMIPEFRSVKVEKEEPPKDFVKQPPPDPSVLTRRPPVVTIMGHVDHGKTTLLDKLRNSNIVDQEFGGITQHIGAFKVIMPSGETICFLDTPGHAAFSAMRARGAHLTDIVVLVVAADDGVMQQTLESIRHAQDAGVPVIVAINKIDKNNADVAKTKQMLLEHEIHLEEFGGDVQAVPISALKGTNIIELQEAIVTQAELMNLKGDPVGLVEGRVVEARIDEKRGRLVTAVIQRGTLKRGDYLIAGTAWAKVRAMFDEFGNPLQSAPPSTPVEILGFREIPSAGEELLQIKTESELKTVLAWRQEQEKKQKQVEDYSVISEKREEYYKDYKTSLLARRDAGFHKTKRRGPRPKETDTESEELHYAMILKGDVDGSVEAILDTLDTYKSRKCHLDLIHYGVGAVTESDVEMAATFNGDLFAFNVMVPEKVATLARTNKVLIKKHNIIYRLFEDFISSINRKLPKVEEHVVMGEAKVLQVFEVTLPNKTKANVAGCRCTEGAMSKKLGLKVMRDGEIVYTGKIVSLKHFKAEVDSIKKEQECGICIDDPGFDFQPQDVLACYEIKMVDQEIDWQPGF